MKQKDCSCQSMLDELCADVVALQEKFADLQVERDEDEQDCDHEGIVTHMNKWRRKYKKAFKDAETFWKYYHKELMEQLEGDYEIEDNDDDVDGYDEESGLCGCEDGKHGYKCTGKFDCACGKCFPYCIEHRRYQCNLCD